jgi:hypothetical protein
MLVEWGMTVLGCVQVASSMLDKCLFEAMVCVFWAWAYNTIYIHGGTDVGSPAQAQLQYLYALLSDHCYCVLP